jgi:hypothetical protein
LTYLYFSTGINTLWYCFGQLMEIDSLLHVHKLFSAYFLKFSKILVASLLKQLIVYMKRVWFYSIFCYRNVLYIHACMICVYTLSTFFKACIRPKGGLNQRINPTVHNGGLNWCQSKAVLTSPTHKLALEGFEPET